MARGDRRLGRITNRTYNTRSTSSREDQTENNPRSRSVSESRIARERELNMSDEESHSGGPSAEVSPDEAPVPGQENQQAQDVPMEEGAAPGGYSEETVPDRRRLAASLREARGETNEFKSLIQFLTDLFSERRSEDLLRETCTEDFVAEIQYQGFDVIATRTIIVRKLYEFYNGNAQSINEAIARLCLLYVHRGNNVNTILNTIAENAKNYYGPIIRTIPVHAKLVKSNLRTCVTLARVSLCFPELTFDVAESTGSQNVTNMDLFASLPASMRTNSFPALCKATNDDLKNVVIVNALKAHVLYQCYASKIYAKQPLNITKDDIVRQRGFAEITMRNSLVSSTRQAKAFFTGDFALAQPEHANNVLVSYSFKTPSVMRVVDMYNGIML